MAKPRIFVSSTYIDLKHARRHIDGFIKSLGYETVLFESGDITFHHDTPIDESCYAEIENCHMLVLIVGGKYGSPASDAQETTKDTDKQIEFYNSITKKEYTAARDKNLPIFIFVEKGVYLEYQTFKKNRDVKGIVYAHVDNVNIFHLLDDIISQKVNNYVKTFENFEEITSWLKDQWSGMFADFLIRKNSDTNLLTLQNQLSDLNEISKSLKKYNEELLKKVFPKESSKIIQQEDEKIEHRKVLRFERKPLIKHLINMLKRQSDFRSLSIQDIYKNFSESTDLEDFCHKIGLNDENTSFVVNSRIPQSDYLELKEEL